MADPLTEEDGREFDYLMARAGITIPPDRRAGALAGLLDVRDHVKRIWSCRTEAEPMTTFKLKPLAKSKN